MNGMSIDLFSDLRSLTIAGGATDSPSVLGLVEDFLAEPDRREKVVTFAVLHPEHKTYLSLIDFLLSELMEDDFKEACIRYYQGRGKLFKHEFPPEVVRDVDKRLTEKLKALVIKLTFRALPWRFWGNLGSRCGEERARPSL